MKWLPGKLHTWDSKSLKHPTGNVRTCTKFELDLEEHECAEAGWLHDKTQYLSHQVNKQLSYSLGVLKYR